MPQGSFELMSSGVYSQNGILTFIALNFYIVVNVWSKIAGTLAVSLSTLFLGIMIPSSNANHIQENTIFSGEEMLTRGELEVVYNIWDKQYINIGIFALNTYLNKYYDRAIKRHSCFYFRIILIYGHICQHFQQWLFHFALRHGLRCQGKVAELTILLP